MCVCCSSSSSSSRKPRSLFGDVCDVIRIPETVGFICEYYHKRKWEKYLQNVKFWLNCDHCVLIQVIKVDGDQYDVRFFGGHHQRALIEKSHIRPISVNIHTLQVKRTSSWNKACEELKRHQDLLDKLRNNALAHLDSSSDDEDDDDNSSDGGGGGGGGGDEEKKKKEKGSQLVSQPRKLSRPHKLKVLHIMRHI